GAGHARPSAGGRGERHLPGGDRRGQPRREAALRGHGARGLRPRRDRPEVAVAAALHPRLRRDLVWRRLVIEGHDTFVWRDDLANEYTKLDPISSALALRLDGATSPEDLLAYASETWPGLEFDADYIEDLLRDLRQMKFL